MLRYMQKFVQLFCFSELFGRFCLVHIVYLLLWLPRFRILFAGIIMSSLVL